MLYEVPGGDLNKTEIAAIAAEVADNLSQVLKREAFAQLMRLFSRIHDVAEIGRLVRWLTRQDVPDCDMCPSRPWDGRFIPSAISVAAKLRRLLR